MKKKKYISIALILSIVVIVLVFLALKYENNRSSFIVKIQNYYQSSAGTDRKLDGRLVFVDKKVISGSQSYVVTPAPNCSKDSGDCGSWFECVVENQQWVDAVSKGKCNMPSYVIAIPLTEEGLKQKIRSGEFKNISECSYHGDTCYEITNK